MKNNIEFTSLFDNPRISKHGIFYGFSDVGVVGIPGF